jgi:hypothetical protein
LIDEWRPGSPAASALLVPPEEGRTNAILDVSKGAMRKLNAHGIGSQAEGSSRWPKTKSTQLRVLLLRCKEFPHSGMRMELRIAPAGRSAPSNWQSTDVIAEG